MWIQGVLSTQTLGYSDKVQHGSELLIPWREQQNLLGAPRPRGALKAWQNVSELEECRAAPCPGKPQFLGAVSV